MDIELSIIIPAFNEQDNITPLYQELNKVLSDLGKSYEIIFIDDGSTDATFARLEELHKIDPLVKVIKFKKNFGQSAAMKAGFDHAHGKLLITMDADLQNDPQDIPRMIDKMAQGYDAICGWRHKRNDRYSKKELSKLANWFRSGISRCRSMTVCLISVIAILRFSACEVLQSA